MDVFDIVEKNGEKHVITKIVNGDGATVETMPLDEFLRTNERFMYVNGSIVLLGRI